MASIQGEVVHLDLDEQLAFFAPDSKPPISCFQDTQEPALCSPWQLVPMLWGWRENYYADLVITVAATVLAYEIEMVLGGEL